MAKPLHIECEGVFYHVTSCGNERKKIFYAKADFNLSRNDLFKVRKEELLRKQAQKIMGKFAPFQWLTPILLHLQFTIPNFI